MEESKIATLKLQIKQAENTLTRFESFIDGLEEPIPLTEIRLRYMKLVHVLESFNAFQSQLEILEPEESESITRDDFENRYFALCARVEDLLSSRSQVPEIPASSSNPTTRVRLPKLELPKFDGTHTKWVSFHDSFEAIVNQNKDLNEVERFHYLKSCLVGDAAHLIQSLSISKENYYVAWQLLTKRFGNQWLIVSEHLTAIFSCLKIEKESYSALRSLLDKVELNLRALAAMGIDTSQWDLLLVHIIVNRLDFNTRKEWELHRSENKFNELPKFTKLLTFLNWRCNTLESLHQSKTSDTHKEKTVPKRCNIVTKNACQMCKSSSHQIYQCPSFLKLTPKDRITEAKRLRLCINCLKDGHFVTSCQASTCRICKKNHNSLLHLSIITTQAQADANPANSSNRALELNAEAPTFSPSISNHSAKLDINTQILLSTAIILVADNKGQFKPFRALLDQGSQTNFISERCCNQLGIPKQNINVPVSGILQKTSSFSKSANISIKSHITNYSEKVTCLVSPTITFNLPNQSFKINPNNIPKDIQLADPQFNVSRPIDILLGAEHFLNYLCVGQIQLGKKQPTFQNTVFGWIVGGYAPISSSIVDKNTTVCNLTLKNQLAKFWEIEDENNHVSSLSPAEQICENHFTQTHSRNEHGRFIVRLPFKPNIAQIGSSKENAVKRLVAIEKKLERDNLLKLQYHGFMQEYLSLGHMTISNIPDKSPHFYLPHHSVIKIDSVSTKLRVVFDGSCKTSSGISLNDNLLVGPTIQQDIFSILIRFRKHRYCLVADINKMYRQILVHPDDRQYQKIVWRENPIDPIQSFELATVTYGTSCAPFLATRCLKQLAIESTHAFPLTSRVIGEDFYVDDVLTGANSKQEAIQLRDQLVDILNSGGFQLSKWASNCSAILPQDNANLPKHIVLKHSLDEAIKTLGLLWESQEDVFTYKVKSHFDCTEVTKRSVLSVIAQIFDPLGLVGPVIAKAKTILQQLWIDNLGWDTVVPNHIHTIWMTFVKELGELSNVVIPRHILPTNSLQVLEIHGFADASESCYGACIYIRCLDLTNNCKISLLCSKSRVAPIKKLSIPRLELCAALLLSRLMDKTKAKLNLSISYTYLWTDSTIVLSWLKAPSSHYQTFVANRVSEIQTITKECHWRHVRSNENPADLISRGLLPNQIVNNRLWWEGPTWLKQSSNSWPDFEFVPLADLPEMRKIICYASTISPTILQKYSSLSKLQRTIAWCLRAISNLKSPSQKNHRSPERSRT